LVILLLLTLVSVSTVVWLGRSLVLQEGIVEAQSARERLEKAADRIADKLRRSIDTGELHGLSLVVSNGAISVAPPERLLYYPQPGPLPEAPSGIFREAEAHEFREGQPLAAIAPYERLARSPDAAVQAGALLRLARVERKLGRKDQ